MVTGIVRLLIGFAVDGKAKYLLVVKPVGYGLDEEAGKGARGIKFIPSTRGRKIDYGS